MEDIYICMYLISQRMFICQDEMNGANVDNAGCCKLRIRLCILFLRFDKEEKKRNYDSLYYRYQIALMQKSLFEFI